MRWQSCESNSRSFGNSLSSGVVLFLRAAWRGSNKDLKQSAQRKGGEKSEKDRSVNRGGAEGAEKTPRKC